MATPTIKKSQQGHRTPIPIRIHKGDSDQDSGLKTQDSRLGIYSLPLFLTSCVLCLVSCVFLTVTGCSSKGQYIDALFAATSSQLARAQKAGAEQLAESEFEDSKSLFAEAENALKNKDKQVGFLIQKAHAKARLAEALARQTRAERELAKLEAELNKASAEANRVRLEREAAERELAGLTPR